MVMINEFDQVFSSLIQAVIPGVMTYKEVIFPVQIWLCLTETVMSIDICVILKL